MSSPSWFVENGREHAFMLARLALHILYCSISSVLIYIIFVHLCLFKRFLRIRFGKKVQPDGTKAVIVTGATSGFGLAIAKRLYKRGFTVFACYYNDQEDGYGELLNLKLVKTSQAPAENSGSQNLFLIKMDVRSSESIESSAREISKLMDSHGLKLHCLLNNAGISADGSFEFTDGRSIRNLLDTNVVGVYQVSKEFILRIIKDQGRVVNVSSGVYVFPGQTISLYGSSKAAVSYFSDSLNEDLKLYRGAACYTIVPGNLILHSNIIFTRIKFLQNSLAQLSDEEREVYRVKIEENTEALYGLLRKRLANSSEDERRRLADLYRIQLPESSGGSIEGDKSGGLKMLKRVSLFQRLMLKLLRFSDGGSRGQIDLESTGVIDGFESAILLRKPPRRTYAGSKYYQFISGPITNYLPAFILGSLGHLMALNLALSK